jgi:hypothetical protein
MKDYTKTGTIPYPIFRQPCNAMYKIYKDCRCFLDCLYHLYHVTHGQPYD